MIDTDLLISLTTYYIAGAFTMFLMVMVLNHFHRRAYLIIWSFSWAVLFVAYFSLYYGLYFEMEPLVWIYAFLLLISVFFHHKGCFIFMDRPYPNNRFYGFAAMMAIILATLYIEPFKDAGLHTLFFFSGVLFIDSGHTFYRSKKRPFIIYGLILFAYGILIAFYPYLNQLIAFTDLFNTLVILFGMGVAYGMVAMHLFNVYEKEQALHDSLYYLSYHDHLTGLRNRNYLESFLDSLDENRATNATLLMADLDTLKIINDRHGHQAGDEMIIRAGEVLAETTGESDLLVRYGGDEFVAVYANRDVEEMHKIKETIKTRMQEESIRGVSLSFSIGVAFHEGSRTSIHESLRIAEKRMYEDKRNKESRRY